MTREMVELFESWTRRHIDYVRQNLRCMEGYEGLKLEDLEARGLAHDASKFLEPERSGYVWLTWALQNRVKLSGELAGLVEQSLARHRSVNPHHPEFHSDLNEMSLLDLVEMVCDWHAITLENGQDISATRRWTDVHLPLRWSFSISQTQQIYSILSELGGRLGDAGYCYETKKE